MQRRQFLKISALTASSIFLKMPMFSQESRTLLSKAFDAEKKYLSKKPLLININYDHNKEIYIYLLKKAASKYNELYSEGFSMNNGKIREAASFFANFIYNEQGMGTGKDVMQIFNEAIRQYRLDTHTSTLMFGDFFAEIGADLSEIKYVSFCESAKTLQSHSLLKVGSLYFETLYETNATPPIKVVAYAKNQAKKKYISPPEEFSLTDEALSQNLDAIISVRRLRLGDYYEKYVKANAEYEKNGRTGSYLEVADNKIACNLLANENLDIVTNLFSGKGISVKSDFLFASVILDFKKVQIHLTGNLLPNEAIYYLEDAISKYSGFWKAYPLLSECYFQLGEIEKARKTLKKGISLTPEGEKKQESLRLFEQRFGKGK